jgi:murein L,D-transpeptidase YafK
MIKSFVNNYFNKKSLSFMSKIYFSVIVFLILNLSYLKNDERVEAAKAEKGKFIEQILQNNNIKPSAVNILLVAYKFEKELEIYAKNTQDSTYSFLKAYKICTYSGKLGPKRQQGDLQVPEGFYYINRFNPQSEFYLSLRINYPNKADIIKSKAFNLGGNIYIHGSCASIGCMPMTDDKIKEIYLLALTAKEAGQNQIPVYIYPYKLNDKNLRRSYRAITKDAALLQFWDNLKKGHDLFEKNKKQLNVTVDKNGDYQF